MSVRFLIVGLFAVAAVTTSSPVAQTMKPRYDQKCLDEAGKAYIRCMARATTEVAKDQCGKEKVEAEKKCKL